MTALYDDIGLNYIYRQIRRQKFPLERD